MIFFTVISPPNNSPEPPPIMLWVPPSRFDVVGGAAQLLSLGDWRTPFHEEVFILR